MCYTGKCPYESHFTTYLRAGECTLNMPFPNYPDDARCMIDMYNVQFCEEMRKKYPNYATDSWCNDYCDASDEKQTQMTSELEKRIALDVEFNRLINE